MSKNIKTTNASTVNGDDHGYKQTINVCMIGPSGVGKTSLLATMYKTLQNGTKGRFLFEPISQGAFDSLHEKYISLQGMLNKPACTRVVNTDKGTMGVQEYPFGLDYVAADGAKTKIALVNFFDTPGAMTSTMDAALQQKIRESHIIINAIDAGVMMKADNLNAEKYNGYSEVKRLLDHHAFSGGGNKLVVFTLIKAETWITKRSKQKGASSDASDLIDQFRNHCRALINSFPPSAPRLAVLCPVETLGCVEFSMVSRDEDNEQLVHYKRMAQRDFSPRHVQLPLYFALRFVLSEWCKNQGFFERLFGKIFGVYSEVVTALGEMDSGVIETANHSPVKPLMYGNQALLEVK